MRVMASNEGTLDQGLYWYTTKDGLAHHLWRLGEPVKADLPDQGIAKPAEVKEATDAPARASSSKALTGMDVDSKPEKLTGGTLCKICQKPRRDHPNRLFCELKKEDKDKDKGKGKKQYPIKGKVKK